MVRMALSYHIEPFDGSQPAQRMAMARLHALLLPQSPASKLGLQFLERFYYTWLPREGKVFGAIAYVDDAPVGFIAATSDSAGFMPSTLSRRWPWLAWALARSVLQSPRRLGSILDTWRIMAARKPVRRGLREGEILSMGVLPAYREPEFIHQSRIRVAHDLLEAVMGRFQAQDVPLVRAIVDSDNYAAQFFYSALGWSLGREQVPGWRVPSIEFVWERPPAGEVKAESGASPSSITAGLG